MFLNYCYVLKHRLIWLTHGFFLFFSSFFFFFDKQSIYYYLDFDFVVLAEAQVEPMPLVEYSKTAEDQLLNLVVS